MAKGLLAILGPPKGEEDADADDKPASESKSLEVNAMSDLLDAIKAEDHESMAAAFKRAYSACAAKGEESDEAEEY